MFTEDGRQLGDKMNQSSNGLRTLVEEQSNVSRSHARRLQNIYKNLNGQVPAGARNEGENAKQSARPTLVTTVENNSYTLGTISLLLEAIESALGIPSNIQAQNQRDAAPGNPSSY